MYYVTCSQRKPINTIFSKNPKFYYKGKTSSSRTSSTYDFSNTNRKANLNLQRAKNEKFTTHKVNKKKHTWVAFRSVVYVDVADADHVSQVHSPRCIVFPIIWYCTLTSIGCSNAKLTIDCIPSAIILLKIKPWIQFPSRFV